VDDFQLRWSLDQSEIAMTPAGSGAALGGHTYVIPLPAGRVFPELPDGGFRTEDAVAALPGARRIESPDVVPGRVAGEYAVGRTAVERNLYRIPIR
jgi:hypothetical protein